MSSNLLAVPILAVLRPLLVAPGGPWRLLAATGGEPKGIGEGISFNFIMYAFRPGVLSLFVSKYICINIPIHHLSFQKLKPRGGGGGGEGLSFGWCKFRIQP